MRIHSGIFKPAFAAFSTILAVFENIISCGMDLFHWDRKKSCMINLVLITVLSLPCVFGFNIWYTEILLKVPAIRSAFS